MKRFQTGSDKLRACVTGSEITWVSDLADREEKFQVNKHEERRGVEEGRKGERTGGRKKGKEGKERKEGR